jgi:hypothetical protein
MKERKKQTTNKETQKETNILYIYNHKSLRKNKSHRRIHKQMRNRSESNIKPSKPANL